jgi:hypothetical protein
LLPSLRLRSFRPLRSTHKEEHHEIHSSLYFYLVAFISIEVVVWGLIGLLRSMVDDVISGRAEALAQALALILVGVPIFLSTGCGPSAPRPVMRKKDCQHSCHLSYTQSCLPHSSRCAEHLSFIDRSLVQATGWSGTRLSRIPRTDPGR